MTGSHAKKEPKGTESGGATNSLAGSVVVIKLNRDGGESDGQGGNMSDGIEVFSTVAVMNPKPGLAGILEA